LLLLILPLILLQLQLHGIFELILFWNIDLYREKSTLEKVVQNLTIRSPNTAFKTITSFAVDQLTKPA